MSPSIASHDDTTTHSQPFRSPEFQTLLADDANTGKNICKILAALFTYTFLAMLVVILWTFRVLGYWYHSRLAFA